MRASLRESVLMAEVRRRLFVAACGKIRILTSESENGRRCTNDVWAHSVQLSRSICCSSVLSTRLRIYVLCARCFEGTAMSRQKKWGFIWL